MDILQTLINKLRHTRFAHLNSRFDDCLAGIDKYFDTDEQKAFMLGYLFTNNPLTKNLPKDTGEILIQTIKDENLQDYFYHQSKPEFDNIKAIGLICLIVGVVAIGAGIFQLINNNIGIGINNRYSTPVVIEGGTILIIGLVFSIGGLIRYRFETQRKKFIESLEGTHKSS